MKDERPDLVKEFDSENDEPVDSLTCGSAYRAIWNCARCGHQWEARVQSRVKENSGCPTLECQRIKRKKTRAATAKKLETLKLSRK